MRRLHCWHVPSSKRKQHQYFVVDCATAVQQEVLMHGLIPFFFVLFLGGQQQRQTKMQIMHRWLFKCKRGRIVRLHTRYLPRRYGKIRICLFGMFEWKIHSCTRQCQLQLLWFGQSIYELQHGMYLLPKWYVSNWLRRAKRDVFKLSKWHRQYFEYGSWLYLPIQCQYMPRRYIPQWCDGMHSMRR